MATLQEQINAAPLGSTITLPDGSEHIGNFVFPRSIHLQGKATLISPNAAPAIDIPLQARGITFTDIMAKSSNSMVYDIVRIGTWQNIVLADCPADITFNRVDIFGMDGQEVQRGIRADGANVSVLNSQIRAIHGKGYDTQAFFAGNGPGPFRLIDSYFEASGENILFGGADACIQNLIPSDIEIRRCRLFKPLEWRGVWSVKNLLELKNARRVVIEGCVFENCWGDAQIGFGVLFTVRNQDGGNPWATVEDVIFTNNELLNVAGGFQLIGKDWPNVSAQGARIQIINNLIRMAQKGALGPNGRLLQMESTKDVTFENNDADPDHTFIVLAGEVVQTGLVYRKNLLTRGEYGITSTGLLDKAALDKFAAGYDFSQNTIIAPWDASPLYPTGNTFVASRPEPVPAGIGVNMEALKAAQSGIEPTPMPQPFPTPVPTPIPEPVPAPTPVPIPTISLGSHIEVVSRVNIREAPSTSSIVKSTAEIGEFGIATSALSAGRNKRKHFCSG
jgi:hypothetical protein